MESWSSVFVKEMILCWGQGSWVEPRSNIGECEWLMRRSGLAAPCLPIKITTFCARGGRGYIGPHACEGKVQGGFCRQKHGHRNADSKIGAGGQTTGWKPTGNKQNQEKQQNLRDHAPT
jgi:hypothetical protein